jgi:hypothetical protein
MRYVFRVIALLVVVPATFFFVYWVPLSYIRFYLPFIEYGWIPNTISLLCATGVGWYVWKKLGAARHELLSSILLGAAVLGAIGFCAGFFGPLIFAPEANQGPLLGIFISGPLGLSLGAIGGFLYWLMHRKKVETNIAE